MMMTVTVTFARAATRLLQQSHVIGSELEKMHPNPKGPLISQCCLLLIPLLLMEWC